MNDIVQNALTQPMRRAASAANRAGLLSLWTGQGIRMLRELPAEQLMLQLKHEVAQALAVINRQLA